MRLGRASPQKFAPNLWVLAGSRLARHVSKLSRIGNAVLGEPPRLPRQITKFVLEDPDVTMRVQAEVRAVAAGGLKTMSQRSESGILPALNSVKIVGTFTTSSPMSSISITLS
jgi:hypothetical protein